jgi:hypothetical protein
MLLGEMYWGIAKDALTQGAKPSTGNLLDIPSNPPPTDREVGKNGRIAILSLNYYLRLSFISKLSKWLF